MALVAGASTPAGFINPVELRNATARCWVSSESSAWRALNVSRDAEPDVDVVRAALAVRKSLPTLPPSRIESCALKLVEVMPVLLLPVVLVVDLSFRSTKRVPVEPEIVAGLLWPLDQSFRSVAS